MAGNNSRPKFSREKYEDMIKTQVSLAIRRDLSDPRFTLLSITKVELNKDFSVAKVFWDTFDAKSRGEIKLALDNIKGKMRSIIARELDVRHTPELHFIYDSQYEDEFKITNLLSEENDK
jgi:ribosome-binding factor A